MKEKKQEQGITLIALIITVIIMLILVAVSIDLIVNDKLFNSAGDAVSKTNEKVEQQQNRVDELMGELNKIEGKKDSEYNNTIITQLNGGIAVIQTAEGAMNESHLMLLRVYELMVQYSNDTNTEEDKNSILLEVTLLLDELTHVVESTMFNNTKLLDGTFAKNVGIEGIYLQIDNLSADALHLTSNTLEEDLSTPEGVTAYLEEVQGAIQTVAVNRSRCGAAQNSLTHLLTFFEEENNIIAEGSSNADEKIAKLALETIKPILQRNYELVETVQNGAYTDDDKEACEIEMEYLVIAIDILAEQADHNGQKLLDGTFKNINEINSTTLGEGTKLSTDLSTDSSMSVAATQYQKAIEIIDAEIAKL